MRTIPYTKNTPDRLDFIANRLEMMREVNGKEKDEILQEPQWRQSVAQLEVES
jgi:hypothetical protein